MGIVYSAFDELMNRRVAIKVMTAEIENDPDTSERFYREAYAAGQLVHRNLITIFDVGDDDGRPYIVMELLESCTLGEYLKRPDGVRLEEKLALMLQLCDGMQLAHSRGIFHRDIKPGNLMVSADGDLKIVDFGIARLASSNMTMTGLIVGTPDYMSPEQAMGREVDERSDLFSAGAVLYFMLTGRKPFASSDMHTVLDRVQFDDPLPIRDAEAPPALVAVVQRALAKSLAARYQTATFMAADLRRAQRELATDTSRICGELRTLVAAIDTASTERQWLCEALGAEPAAADGASYRASLTERLPTARAWLDDADAEPLDWISANERRKEVVALHHALDEELATLSRAAADMRNGDLTMQTGDVADALQCFEAALQAVPSSVRAREGIERARGLLADNRAAEDRAHTLVIEAQEAASRADWSTVLVLTAQALAANAGNAAAADLRDQATSAKQAAARARRRQCEKAVQRAESLALEGLFTEAERALDEARSFDLDGAIVPAVEANIRAVRLDAERASAAERRRAEALAAARLRFDKGERVQALGDLEAFLAREPQSPNVSAALANLRSEAARLAEEDRRREAAAEQAREAEAALERGELEHAVALARQALGGNPKDPLARQVEGVATARLHERALARERQAAAARAMQDARALLARRKFRAAREAARIAVALCPDDAAATALVEVIMAEEAQAQELVQREEDARRRAKAAAPVVAMARAAEAERDFSRAGWLAENALALDVDCAEANGILERARATLAAEPALADETVRVGSSGTRTPDPDDTLTLSPVRPAWRRLGDTLIQRLAGGIKRTR